MTQVSPLPATGAVFFDARDGDRTLRASWHADTAAFVLSVWQGGRCTATFQLPAADAPRLVHAVTAALAAAQQGAGQRWAAG